MQVLNRQKMMGLGVNVLYGDEVVGAPCRRRWRRMKTPMTASKKNTYSDIPEGELVMGLRREGEVWGSGLPMNVTRLSKLPMSM